MGENVITHWAATVGSALRSFIPLFVFCLLEIVQKNKLSTWSDLFKFETFISLLVAFAAKGAYAMATVKSQIVVR